MAICGVGVRRRMEYKEKVMPGVLNEMQGLIWGLAQMQCQKEEVMQVDAGHICRLGYRGPRFKFMCFGK